MPDLSESSNGNENKFNNNLDIDKKDLRKNISVLQQHTPDTETSKKEELNSFAEDIKFSWKIKYLVFTIAVVSQILNQASTDELYPALPAIQDEFKTTTTVTNMNVSVHTLVIGILSAVWASYADSYGRRPIFIASNAFSVVGNVGSALAVNTWMLLVFRLVTAVGAAASNAIGAGLINDVFEDYQKGKVISWFSCASLYTMGFSPFVGGAISQYLGWRWIFWIFVIVYGLLWVTIIFLLPETNKYARNQKSQQQQQRNNSIETESSSSINPRKTGKRISKKTKIINPFSSLKLLKFPNMLLCCLYFGWMAFTNNAVALSFTWAYSGQYNFSSTLVGLFYLSGLVGTTAASYLGGLLSDRIYRRRVERANMSNPENESEEGQIFPEMRLSQSVIFVAAIFLVASYVGYGWSIEKNVHFSVGIICQTFAQFGYTLTCCFIVVYVVQSFPKHGSSGQACVQTIKCAFITAGRFSAIELQNLLGPGVLYTVLGGTLLVASPFITYIQHNRSKWQKGRETIDW